MSNRPGTHRIGWIGVGNMGYPLVSRLLETGCDVAVYNRTRSKAEPLTKIGATVVDRPVELADRDIVFTVVSGPADFVEVMLGDDGVLSGSEAPQYLVDCSTISADASDKVRGEAERRGSTLIAAPISGNGEVVALGRALFAMSGPEAAAAEVRPYLEAMGRGAHYLGEGDDARLVKIAHNLFLGAVIQSLVETTLLVQTAGIPRAGYLDFINESVLGSMFSAYKTPALVGLDWTPTFNSKMLRKDLDLGLEAAAEHDLDLPVTDVVRRLVQEAIDAGHAEEDFAAMLDVQARAAGMALEVEERPETKSRQFIGN